MKYTFKHIAFIICALPFSLLSQIANGYIADVGIETNTNVIFAEMFEQPTTSSLVTQSGYSTSTTFSNISFDSSVPPGSLGTQSCKLTTIESSTSTITIHPNEDTYLIKKFSSGISDSVFVRYYIKFNNTHTFHHSGVYMGGNNPAWSWGAPAGSVPSGDSAFKIGSEIRTANVIPQNTAKFGFYNYWANMHVAGATPPFWGNDFRSPNPNATINMSQWNCIEVMIKLNATMTDSTGELALWVNGNKVAHYGKGFPLGTWNAVSFNEGSGNPFNGFLYRTNPALMFNYIWIKNYAPDNTGYTSPNDLLFDHVVVATKYIGPMNTSTDIKNALGKENRFEVYPSPTNDILHFSLELKNVEIFNTLGEKVKSQEEYSNSISVEDLPKGLYFIRANNYVKKFVIQ